MNEGQGIQSVSVDNKPKLGQIDDYFRQRLQGNQKGIVSSTDSLNNTVFTSLGHKEATLDDFHSATLVVSDIGKNIIRHNRGLLHRIAQGKIEGKEIGKGMEGRVYKVILDTEHGPQPFALKYTFPVDRPASNENIFGHHTLFTPGVDQMRLLQLFDQQKPLEGFHTAVPVLATLDVTLTPFVEHSIGGDLSLSILKGDVDDLKDRHLLPQDKALLEEIIESNNNVDENERFGRKFARALEISTEGLKEWVNNRDKSPFLKRIIKGATSLLRREEKKENVSLVAKEVSIEEGIHNLVVSLDKLADLYGQFKKKEGIFASKWDEESPEFKKMVRECCHIVELIAGYKSHEQPK